MKNNMDLYADNGMMIYDGRIYFLKELYGADGQPADNFYLVDFRCDNLENVPGVSAYEFTGEGGRSITWSPAPTISYSTIWLIIPAHCCLQAAAA